MSETLLDLELGFNFLFIGFNPRLEVPLLNWRIKKSYLKSVKFNAYSIGLSLNYTTFPIINLGNTLLSLSNFLEGKSSVTKLFLQNDFINTNYFGNSWNQGLSIFIGNSILMRKDFLAVISNIKLANFNFKHKINVISRFIGRSNYADIIPFINRGNIYKKKAKKNKFNYMIGVDLDSKINLINNMDFSVYQGSFIFENIENKINLLLPSSIYIENKATYLNSFGKLCKTEKIINTKTLIRDDKNIINAIYIYYNIVVGYSKLRENIKFFKKFKFISTSGISNSLTDIIESSYKNLEDNVINIKVVNNLISSELLEFYNSDFFIRNSKIMGLCAARVKFVNIKNK